MSLYYSNSDTVNNNRNNSNPKNDDADNNKRDDDPIQLLNDIQSILEYTITLEDGRTVAYAIAGAYNNKNDEIVRSPTSSVMLFLDDTSIDNNNEQQQQHMTTTTKKKRIFLFFYPAAWNCRCLLLLHRIAIQANIVFLCINRPGKYGTSNPSKTVVSSSALSDVNACIGMNSCNPNEMQQQQSSTIKKSIAQIHIDTTLKDIISVLDFNQIEQIDGIFCMCAGCPFAMKFTCQYPDRLSNTIKFISAAGWVLPSDCGWYNTSTFYSLGTIVPRSISSSVFGGMNYLIQQLIQYIPKDQLNEFYRSQLSPDELILYDTSSYGQELDHSQIRYTKNVINISDYVVDNDDTNKASSEQQKVVEKDSHHKKCCTKKNNNGADTNNTADDTKGKITVLVDGLEWMFRRNEETEMVGTTATNDTNADRSDIAVLLSKSDHIGIDYDIFYRNMVTAGLKPDGNVRQHDSATATTTDSSNPMDADTKDGSNNIIWFHGTNDKTVPFASAKWLAQNPKSKLYDKMSFREIKDGSHSGVLLLLYDVIKESFQ